MKMHERIVELLQAEGIDTIFGIPDPSFFAMFMTAEARGMNVVAPHHEQAGALMADGLYRLTGKPGVMGINKGPGVANIAAGVAYLVKENVPAVFIMAQRQRVYEQRVRRGKMQYLSQPPLFEGMMKYIGTIEYPDQVDEIFHEAFRRATNGVPGPTMVELPLSVAQAQLDLPPAPPPHRYRLVRQQAGTDAVAEAARLLGEAEMPVMLVGQGAFASRAHADLAALARKLNCPILATPSVEAVLEGLDGHSFPYGSAAATEAVARADVVLAIGTEIGENMHYGRGVHWAKGKADRKWIYIERDPTAIGVNRPIDVPLVGDLLAVVPQLTKALGAPRAVPAEMAGWARAHADQKAALTASISTVSQPIHTGRLAIEATRVLPKDAVIVRDGGASSMWFSALMQITPRDAMWNSNYGAIGPGLPYAIGAQMAIGPDRRAVLLTGDSSVLFHIAELETAVRKNLPVIVIVAVDHAWGIEVASYKANFGADTPTPEARWSPAVRLDKTAESFGAYGEYVDRAEDIAPAVERAIATGRPALIHVEVDREANSTFVGLPGMGEFRTWYGEEGDNLGVIGGAPTATAAKPGEAPMGQGSGY
ncbi:thiamine pyrophosphate-binding protein [Sphingomonas naphthae]|uniref:Thiamine pyrophosphate-binding protein n=1 Tax=Sphingomonas naphthae TaxID=1813468 RepID=A0ABY7TQG8_9SPHN|nr:thiamine pyrophosphate-binding protein [Sphingomonas naphthae]WCT75483.1 thiamine pyrophosphate-binding protein [Sphingomonas naphthae]